MSGKTNSKRGLTDLQRKLFFIGCREAARELGLDAEKYRHQIMLEELKIMSLCGCNRTDDFDKLMQRVWVDRGDYARALEFVAGDVKRLAYLATEAAKTILKQKGADPEDPHFVHNALRYVATVAIAMNHMHDTVDSLAFKLQRADGWDDFSPIKLKGVVSALQAHIRRRA